MSDYDDYLGGIGFDEMMDEQQKIRNQMEQLELEQQEYNVNAMRKAQQNANNQGNMPYNNAPKKKYNKYSNNNNYLTQAEREKRYEQKRKEAKDIEERTRRNYEKFLQLVKKNNELFKEFNEMRKDERKDKAI